MICDAIRSLRAIYQNNCDQICMSRNVAINHYSKQIQSGDVTAQITCNMQVYEAMIYA